MPLNVEPLQELRLGLMFHRQRKPTPATSVVVELLRLRLSELAGQVRRPTRSEAGKPRRRRS